LGKSGPIYGGMPFRICFVGADFPSSLDEPLYGMPDPMTTIGASKSRSRKSKKIYTPRRVIKHEGVLLMRGGCGETAIERQVGIRRTLHTLIPPYLVHKRELREVDKKSKS